MAPSINLSEQEIDLLLKGLSTLADEAADREDSTGILNYSILHDDIKAQVTLDHPASEEA